MISLKEEIKEILENVKKCCDITKEQNFTVYQRQDILRLLDYITNLQTIEQQYSAVLSENAELKNKISDLQKDLDYQRQAEQEYNEKHTKLMNKYKNLQEENERLNNQYDLMENSLDEKQEVIDKANEYIKENTRWFDSEYAKVYGELCDCAGAKDDRLEVLVNPSNLPKILGGDDNE